MDTLVIIKPDAVRRGLIGEIMVRFMRRKDLKIELVKVIRMTKKQAKEHYKEHKEKSFYKDLVKFMTSGLSILLLCRGDNVIEEVRKMVGNTDPRRAERGTIRGDLKEEPFRAIMENLVHASDSENSAKREIELFLGDKY